jgi:hypothetical protein
LYDGGSLGIHFMVRREFYKELQKLCWPVAAIAIRSGDRYEVVDHWHCDASSTDRLHHRLLPGMARK